jgi:hypothetical protein
MTCNKFLQNRPKKRNPTQKQPTDSSLFFLIFFLEAPWVLGRTSEAKKVPGLASFFILPAVNALHREKLRNTQKID